LLKSYLSSLENPRLISYVVVLVGVTLSYVSLFVDPFIDNDFLLVPSFLISLLGIFMLFIAVSPSDEE